MKRKTTAAILIGAFLSCAVPGRVSAQESPPPDRLNEAYVKGFFKDFGKVCASPAGWRGRDLWTLASIVGGGVILYAADPDIKDWVQKGRSETSNNISGFLTNFGNGLVLSAGLLGVYAVGEQARRPCWRRTALLSLESLGASALFVLGSKFLVGRARPDAHEGSRSFKPFSTGSAHYSMPSGHAASAWAVAATIADQSGSRVVDAVAYGLATLVAACRVHDNKHWTSDVFLGSALGYFTAKKICRLNRPGPPISPSLLESASFSFELSGPRRSVSLNLSW
jgi:membrane-associated phospholipid phosphatase